MAGITLAVLNNSSILRNSFREQPSLQRHVRLDGEIAESDRFNLPTGKDLLHFGPGIVEIACFIQFNLTIGVSRSRFVLCAKNVYYSVEIIL